MRSTPMIRRSSLSRVLNQSSTGSRPLAVRKNRTGISGSRCLGIGTHLLSMYRIRYTVHSHRPDGSAGASPQSCWRLNMFANRGCVSDLDVLAVRDNSGRALRPDRANRVQPLFEHGPKATRPNVFDTPQL